jgi:DNA polymerase
MTIKQNSEVGGAFPPASIKSIFCDVETFSSRSLDKCGVFKYAEAPDFEILLFGFSVDGSEVQVVDLASGENLPPEICTALTDESVLKWAHNAQFERICLSRHLGLQYLPAESWHCTMIWSAYLGLPLSLEGATLATGAEKQKLAGGKDLIRYFCQPCKPTKANGGRTRNLPEHDPQKWAQFKAYNARDVEAEIEIARKFSKFPVPENEWKNFILDQEINDRGIRLDMELVRQAISCDERSRVELTRFMRELTDLENPNSVAQVKAWLAEHGLETDTLGKAAVRELLKTAPGNLAEVLTLRQSLAKSSVKKYTAMENVVGSDGRARGLLQFYGASRTGRFAGRLIQVQNLPKNNLPDIVQARQLVKAGDFDTLEALYDSAPVVLSELIRTAFIPKPGFKFIVADFSSIEAMVIAWLAGEKWKMDVFAGDGKIYEATAARMFNVPIESVTKGSLLRQKAKQTELACGYGGSVGALKAMGALDMGIAEEELKPLVNAWRSANPNIVRFWWEVGRAAMTAVKERTSTETHGIRFSYQSGLLFITLPSDRRLAYVKPRIELNRFGGESVTYEGVGQTKKWERIESYGPKFVENIVQAISRDLLCHAMRQLDEAGLSIVMHVQDEVVIEAPPGVSPEEVCRLMSETPPWAKGLPLRADGFSCQFYKKD